MSTLRISVASLLLLGALGCGDDHTPVAPPPPGPGTPAVTAPQDAGAAAPLAMLRALKGEVLLDRGGKMVPAAEGPLTKRDVVETGPDGFAIIAFSDGRTVEVGPGARFDLDEDTVGVVLNVERGILLSRVPAAPKGQQGPAVQLRILTPYGLTRVGGGQEASEVRVSVGPTESRVEVKLGAIEFVSKDGKELEAAAGESVAVSAGKAELVPSSAKFLELATIQVTVRADTGRVEVRSKGSPQWKSVNKGGQKLAAGDGVRARGGTAFLSLEGSASTLALASGGELVMEGAGQQGLRDEARLDLRQGELALKLASERDSRVVMPGLTLESAGAADLNVRRTSDGFDVAARAGDVTLVQGETRKPLRAGEQARVSKAGEAKVQPVAQAPLTLDAATEDVQVYHQGLPELTLSWKGQGDALVEVASDPGFSKPLLRGTVHQPSLNVAAPDRGRLFWRVRKPDGTEVAKGSATFAPERAPKNLARITNEVPEGPQKTTIFYQDKPPGVIFTYASEPQAAKYRISVYRNGELGKPVAERTVAETRSPLEAGILREGSYVWSVTPLSRSGQPMRGGRMNKLELVYDNSVPVLVVNAPRNGQRAGKRVRTVGVAPVGTKLSINGRSVTLDAKHRFDTWAEPVGVPPVLLFKMQNEGTPDVYVVRTLKRGPEE
ncbi:FecR domain-containing protein [Hyalangium versicolor]|uniref:FecR domain-containing protein n=1 Tax=Hyalangium versicolor TaxID=2861190 RepID=UPI001CC95A15|nr:FecR domain-containing protein [Hyalangium versicolor]